MHAFYTDYSVNQSVYYCVLVPCITITSFILLWFSHKSITANTDCTIGNGCTQGCAIIDGVEICYCLSGYQLSADAISCLGMYSGMFIRGFTGFQKPVRFTELG